MNGWRLGLSILAFFMIGKMAMAGELHIKIVTEGDGVIAEFGKQVTVHYEGRLLDSTVFDASKPRGHPLSFVIGAGQVIQGWERGVEGMKVGEVRQLTIPPELGYGSAGVSDVIPPNATLVFDIELLSVDTPATLGQADSNDLLKAKKDGTIIVDIRRKDEWQQTGIIAGAKTVTAFQENGSLHPDFQQKFMSLVSSPDTPVMLYCRTGNRTTNLGRALIEKLGFTEITHLTKGITGWAKDGHQTVDYRP
jgi:rhodanese-related sulfurtransferase